MTIQTFQFQIEGMTCQGCAKSVKNALLALQGVHHVTVDFETKTATVDIDDNLANYQTIIETIDDAGFDVIANHS